jgi:hypothetical protein
MSRQKHAVAVQDLPFVDSLKELTVTERKRYGLYLAGGGINDYRLYKMKGQGASRKDPTFDPSLGRRGGHSCCNSRVEWRHRVDCKLLRFNDD